jgi:uncharacterized protein (DUF1501 family)
VRSASGLGFTQAQLNNTLVTPNSGPMNGMTFALHPNFANAAGGFAPLIPLFAQGSLAVVCNVGPLVQPLTKPQYLGSSPKPIQLFSHSDQQELWQTSIANIHAPTGWGGRMADVIPAIGAALPISTCINATPIFAVGLTTRPLSIASAPTALNSIFALQGFGTAADELARRASFDYLRTIDQGNQLVAANDAVVQQAIDAGTALNTDPTLTTVFPNTTLGNQLKQVAKVIKVNLTQPTLGLPRQVFYCNLGGFDTHQNQGGSANLNTGSQNTLLTQVSQAMMAFYSATQELGVSNRVTTFTMADFSRTFQPSGSGATVGTDHAWGNHHLVMGDSVIGGSFYGVNDPTSGFPYPTLQLGGTNDVSNPGSGARGRWIPNTSVEEYAATLATWMGVQPGDLNTVFPLLGNFPTSNLGFMNSL